ncbi:MAG: hypothetical protein PHD00_10880 [Bacteroidales bacterium]|nr:hypothetical protein [Bacteroidales bacterium]
MEEYKKSTEGQITGIIGIVMGIIALMVAFIPCVGAIAFVPGGIAIVFSIISIVQANRDNGTKALGIISLVISALAVLIAAAWLMIFGGLAVANTAINNPEKLDAIENELHDVFDDFDLKPQKAEKATESRIDSLESRLRKLEGDTI